MTIADAPTRSRPRTPIDKAALKAKYLAERDKRLRADGNDQYLELKGRLAHFLEDPYTPLTPRAPRNDHVTFAFIGGGFTGLATAARLKEVGVDDVRIIEKGGDFGGTWYWNRYLGAQCDTASMVYMPLLEETGHRPSEKYAHAPEILEHRRRIGRQFGLPYVTCPGSNTPPYPRDLRCPMTILPTYRALVQEARRVQNESGDSRRVPHEILRRDTDTPPDGAGSHDGARSAR